MYKRIFILIFAYIVPLSFPFAIFQPRERKLPWVEAAAVCNNCCGFKRAFIASQFGVLLPYIYTKIRSNDLRVANFRKSFWSCFSMPLRLAWNWFGILSDKQNSNSLPLYLFGKQHKHKPRNANTVNPKVRERMREIASMKKRLQIKIQLNSDNWFFRWYCHACTLMFVVEKTQHNSFHSPPPAKQIQNAANKLRN